jgi:mannose-6-phosphate isomerase-like protein (cupin superfamily)
LFSVKQKCFYEDPVKDITEKERRRYFMVRKTKVAVVEHPRGGEGSVEFHHIVSEEELNGHGSMYAMAVLRPHSSVGWHQHVGNTEPYFILKGKGVFVDNDGTRTEVGPGDVCVIEVGQSHSLENPNDEELVFMALVYNA